MGKCMSRRVTILLNHDLGLDEARRRMSEGFGKIRTSLSGGLMFKFTESWPTPDRLEFAATGLGQKIDGVIDVFPQHVRIEANLPTILAAIAETITGKMEREGKLLLEKK
jgi:hypothetical protein